MKFIVKILTALDMKDKIGLILSHIHVREHERHKFDILEYCINFFESLNCNFFYVVAGHGIGVPTSIKERVHGLYWESTIDDNEIGRGHPRFSIKAYDLLVENNIEFCIKLRASDIILNADKVVAALGARKVLLSEQTSLERRMIGDLFMAGPTSLVRDLWTENSWDYSKSGLYNLFDNATLLAKRSGKDISQFFKESCLFLSPYDINWVTLDNNWNSVLREPWRDLDQSDIWGIKQGYQHYGGFE